MNRRRFLSGATPRRDQGFALILVLWAMTMLALIATAFATTARTNTVIVHNTVENAIARAVADAGVARGILALLEPDDEDEWLADGRVRSFDMETGRVAVSVLDEGGKIDLNAETGEALKNLLVDVGVEEGRAAELVDAIADFRDEDDFVRQHGAEADDYRRAGLDRRPRNQPFGAVEELLDVIGMDLDLYARISPFVTVYSGFPTINPLTAPREVLMAAGVDSAAADEFIAARAEASGFVEAEGLLDLTGELSGFSIEFVDVYTVTAVGTSPGGGRFVREAVIDLANGSLSGMPYRILTWSRRFD